MKIAMVSEHASPLAALGGVDAGGQNVHVAAFASALARCGADVTVYTRRDSMRLPRRVRTDDGYVVEHVDAGPPVAIGKDEMFAYMDEFAGWLERAWRRERPDVAHAHFWMSGYATLEAARSVSIPTLQTFHALGVVKRRHQGKKDTSPRARLAIERRIVHEMDRIIATCTDEVFELLRLGGTLEQVSVVPCGVDVGRFRPDGPRWPRTPGVRRIVVVSRLVERKGIDTVIEALADLPNAELLIAGGPDAADLERDEEARRLMRVAATAGVAERVRLLGCVDRAEVPALMRSGDVVVSVPWYEPFGMVPLEAMACGVPVVVSAVGGLIDTVVHGVTGLHVPPRDAEQLAGALASLFGAEDMRREMGVAAARRARSRYGWNRIARQTLRAYVEVQERRAALPGELVRR